MHWYRCANGHVFNEPGRKPDPDTDDWWTTGCCPKCGVTCIERVNRCETCGAVDADADMTDHCEHR